MPVSIVIAILAVVTDQVTKFFAQKLLPVSGTIAVIKGVFHLTLAGNQGAAFSILRGGTPFFIAVAVVCMFLMAFLLSKPKLLEKTLGVKADDLVVRIGFGLLAGGTLGNLIDRVRFGYVVDFLDFRVWPVFNVADSAITIGGILICYKMLFVGRKNRA